MRATTRFVTPGLITSPLLLVGLMALACGKQAATEAEAPSADDDREEGDAGGMEMIQEFGGMNEEKVNRTVKKLYPSLSECLMKGFERVDFLGGEVAFLVKVNSAGVAESALAERSTLGDYESERCMLETLKASHWPKPVGGKIGLARTSITFDPPGDVRPPVVWSSDDVKEALQEHSADFAACGPGGPFEITAYVATSGRVLAAGISHDDDAGEATASCVIQAVEGMTFASPGSWPAKVTFRL